MVGPGAFAISGQSLEMRSGPPEVVAGNAFSGPKELRRECQREPGRISPGQRGFACSSERIRRVVCPAHGSMEPEKSKAARICRTFKCGTAALSHCPFVLMWPGNEDLDNRNYLRRALHGMGPGMRGLGICGSGITNSPSSPESRFRAMHKSLAGKGIASTPYCPIPARFPRG